MARSVYIVLTQHRVFAFGSAEMAERFARRANRLPSMRGQTIERLSAPLHTGRRVPIRERLRARDAMMQQLLSVGLHGH